jgi:hypothetical protein
MINIKEIPLFGLLGFTIVYMCLGSPENEIWSGLYFIVNYLILMILFHSHKNKIIRIVGISLSISILIFIVLKFFLSLNVEYLRIYNFIPFSIALIGLLTLERKKNALHYRKNI